MISWLKAFLSCLLSPCVSTSKIFTEIQPVPANSIPYVKPAYFQPVEECVSVLCWCCGRSVWEDSADATEV